VGSDAVDTSLRAVFAGRRGRLLLALLLAEFAAAVQGIAYATVLPTATHELHGDRLYGATLAAGTLVTVLVLSLGSGIGTRLGPRRTLLVATALYVGGVALAATAPAMGWLLVGSAVRGVAGGLLAAVGLSAIGGLFPDAVRPRVLGLFALVWLLPSLVGPPLNAAITVAVGWRWAVAWPALVVVLARLLVGRDAGLIPAGGDRQPVALGTGVAVCAGLVVASVASGSGAWGVPLLVVGLVTAGAGGIRTLTRAADGDPGRRRVLLSFAALVAAFFGGDGLVPKAVYTGLDRGVVANATALAAGLVAWSVAGARPLARRRGLDPGVLGAGLVTVALVVEAVAQLEALGPGPALGLAVAGWGVGGLGMGMAYGRLQPEAFDDLAPERVGTVATAVAFAETASVVVGSLLGGGTYSLATTVGVAPRPAIATGFGLMAVVGLAAAVLAGRRTAGTGSSRTGEGPRRPGVSPG